MGFHSSVTEEKQNSVTEEYMTPGVGFFLKTDGTWDQSEIPEKVLKESKFSGHLKINGYDCTVFEMENGDQWAQKTTESSDSIASRVASRYIEAKKKRQKDIVTQVKQSLQGGSMGEWKKALGQYAEKLDEKFIPYFDEAWGSAMNVLQEAIQKIPDSKHDRVNQDSKKRVYTCFKDFVRQLESSKVQLDQKLEDSIDDFRSMSTEPDR